jgi:hypothetical protein
MAIFSNHELVFYFGSVDFKRLQHGDQMLQQAEILNIYHGDIQFNKAALQIYLENAKPQKI